MQRDASIDDQERLCRERAEREGWTITGIFTDRALSGASMLRPGLQDVLNQAQAGKFDVLLCEALDRLSRDQADVATIFKRLSFAEVGSVTLSEGEIGELHVGLKGTMNQLFLKDLAAKTRRGLRGRVERGLSGGGNSYGYDAVRRLGPDGLPVTGERQINDDQAYIIRRVFQEFADGRSPKSIAQRLTSEGIEGPRGALWRDTAIRGHRTRGTGLLNNELYIGRLVWNRLRYIKDPDTGRRVSRLNDPTEWIITDVPDLRIVDDALWGAVKARQEAIEASPRVKGIKATKFWEKRREVQLLTGLIFCDVCGSSLASVGKDYMACSAARKLGTCDQNTSVRRRILENAVLDLMRKRLMQPEAVAQFIKSYALEANAGNSDKEALQTRLRAERDATARKLEGLYDAIAEGLRTKGLQDKLEVMEQRVAELDVLLAAPAPTPVRLHPNLAEMYRRKVRTLSATLDDPEIRPQALEIIRSLIERVTVRHAEDGVVLTLDGALTAMNGLAQNAKSPSGEGPFAGIDVGSAKVVAGAGFEPATFRL
ncbi:recombinase family protein [Flavimaricola marinus]|uniref:recombinase family protein n=1 Tax=Flavimaricola marinus TaxID=1819565 RepID=UPI001FE65A56|nr:recombinase family protein [Flavimaricola marinus]